MQFWGLQHTLTCSHIISIFTSLVTLLSCHLSVSCDKDPTYKDTVNAFRAQLITPYSFLTQDPNLCHINKHFRFQRLETVSFHLSQLLRAI